GAAARLRRPVPEGTVRWRDLRPWRLDQRTLCDDAALSERLDRRPRRTSGELLAQEECRARQAGGRSLRRRTRRHQNADRHLAPRDGDLAARIARYPARAELSPHSVEHDLLEELADRTGPLRERRALAPDFRDGSVEPAAGVTVRVDCCRSGGSRDPSCCTLVTVPL